MNQRGWNKMKTNNKIDLVTFFRRKQPPHTLQKMLSEFLIFVMLKRWNSEIFISYRSEGQSWMEPEISFKRMKSTSLSVLAVPKCVHSSDSENNFSSLNLRRSSWLGSVDRVINANIRKNKASAFAALEMVMMNLKWNPFFHFSHDMHFNFSLPLQAHFYVWWLNSQLGCDS